MGTFQTLISLVILIFVLSVMVQAVQEVIKAALKTKAGVMRQTIDKFMGDHLSLAQVQNALSLRGLYITALESLNKDEFRHLLDGIQFKDNQLQGIVSSAAATVDQIKDNIAASYEAARISFQKTYTRKNKLFAIVMSFLVVVLLNANLITLYEKISSDQAALQAIVGSAAAFSFEKSGKGGSDQASHKDLETTYAESRNEIEKALKSYPILVRTRDLGQDFKGSPFTGILGLLAMGVLVSLGAPFWNDILKGVMGINNTLNANTKKIS